ncbi:MAG TPA: alpha/beta hydrolase [Patescibacteria group bacterium]|nr:alpha/beta hydrolase [Patescibacteria group bacterium]
MRKVSLTIEGIPAILWGESSDKLFIAIHGNRSRKDDEVIQILAEEAIDKGYRVLSFDLPEHGERKGKDYACKVQNCINDLTAIAGYALNISKNISIFACSMGAYFSLIYNKSLQIEQCLFLSPILDMERIINNMLICFSISEERLEKEKVIETPVGQKLYWDDYSYIKSQSVDTWDIPTYILYGSDDILIESDVIYEFVKQHHCRLDVLKHGEHYFHTDGQLLYFREWLRKYISSFNPH